MNLITDNFFMKKALQQARRAFEGDEVPVGCLIVKDDHIIAQTHNQTELLKDVTAHAEILAITAASDYLNSKYLRGCTMYVTLEPCVMCAGALRWAQLDRLVYAASDEKGGFMRYGKEMLHPKTKLEYGILETESKSIIKEFFRIKRMTKK